MRAPLSLQLRFLLASLVPMLALLAVAWGIATWAFTRSLEQRVTDQLQNAAQVLTQGRLPLSPELLQRIAELQGAELALLDSDGGVAASSVGTLAEAAARRLRADPTRAAITGPQRMRLDGEPAVVVVEALGGAHDPRYHRVLLATSLRDARIAGNRAAFGMGLAFLVAGALLSWLMLYLVRGMTAPIQRVVAMANEIAAGRRDVSLPPESAGDVGAIATALNELTAQLRVFEDQLAARSRNTALGEVSARLAHEVRNPLTALKLHLQLLEERVTDADRPTVVRLLDEVRRLELIVAASLTGAQSADNAQHAAPVDPGPAVVEVLDLMEPSMRHRGIALQRDLQPTPRVSIGRDRAKQALLNLLANSADELAQGGRIRVRLGYDEAADRVRLTVEDSGGGIPPARRATILAGEASSKPFGLGLGLKVCQEIAAASGGHLTITDSESLGGACVALDWPSAPDDETRGG